MTTFSTIPVITYSTAVGAVTMEIECGTPAALQDNVAYMVAHEYVFSVAYRSVDTRSLNQ